MNGWSLLGHLGNCTGMAMAPQESMMSSLSAGSATSELGFWVVTCLGPCGDRGRTKSGRDGGGTTRRTIRPFSSLPTMCAPIAMDGDTTFHFVTDGIHAALQCAILAAKGQDIRLGGGVATIQQYLQAGLVDEMHIAVTPVLLGSGEHLFRSIDMTRLGYKIAEHVATEKATHAVFKKSV